MPEKRQINTTEKELLTAEINRLEKDLYAKINWKAITILIFVTVFSAIHIYYYGNSKWSLLSKFLVCLCPILIWVIIENKYKRKKKKKELNELKQILSEDMINILPVETIRIIEFEEKDDEGTVFLIDLNNNHRFYLDDEQYLIPHPLEFPCDKFDIYLDKNFAFAMNKKVYCSGKKIQPIRIPADIKWKFFQSGWPGDLSKEPRTIEEILSEIKTIELNNLL